MTTPSTSSALRERLVAIDALENRDHEALRLALDTIVELLDRLEHLERRVDARGF